MSSPSTEMGIRRDSRTRFLSRKQETDWKFIIGLTVVLTGVTALFTLYWRNLLGQPDVQWTYSGDLWLTVRTAQWIGWGAFSFVYSSHSLLVTLPGFPILLTPAVMLCSALGLSESAPGIFIARPTALLVILPYCLLLSSSALFALDRLARSLGTRRKARRLLLVAQGGGLFSAVVVWGHPEDVLALALIAWSVVAVYEGRFVAAGWLLGGAIAMQLLAILLVPVFIGIVGRKALPSFVLRASLLPGSLFVAEVVPNPRGTLHALFDQPNFPLLDHATPWVLLAPNLGHGEVASGPGRLVAVAAAVALGFLAVRRRQDLASIAWLVALVLSARCVFESVVDPYYVMPAVAVAIVVGLTHRPLRAAGCVFAGGMLSWMTYSHSDKWTYWFEMTGLFAAMLLAARPRRASTAVDSMPDVVITEASSEDELLFESVPRAGEQVEVFSS